MRFILFVDGYTKNKALPQFLKKWLDPQLPNPVGNKLPTPEGPVLATPGRGYLALPPKRARMSRPR